MQRCAFVPQRHYGKWTFQGRMHVIGGNMGVALWQGEIDASYGVAMIGFSNRERPVSVMKELVIG